MLAVLCVCCHCHDVLCSVVLTRGDQLYLQPSGSDIAYVIQTVSDPCAISTLTLGSWFRIPLAV